MRDSASDSSLCSACWESKSDLMQRRGFCPMNDTAALQASRAQKWQECDTRAELSTFPSLGFSRNGLHSLPIDRLCQRPMGSQSRTVETGVDKKHWYGE